MYLETPGYPPDPIHFPSRKAWGAAYTHWWAEDAKRRRSVDRQMTFMLIALIAAAVISVAGGLGYFAFG